MPHQRKRFAVSQLKKFAKLWPVVGLVGARQTGKTTLLRDLIGTENYVSFDDEDLRQDAINSAKIFLAKRKLPLLIDEVQKVPQIFDACKLIVDRKRIPGQFFFTGSTQFSAKVGIRESLTGRIGILQLFPLTLAEAFEKERPKYTSLIHSLPLTFSPEDIAKGSIGGGMPVPMFLRDRDQQDTYWSSWLDTTVYRDLFRVYGRGYDPDVTYRILEQIGKILRNGDWPALQLFDVEKRKLKKYLEAMETLFLLKKIPAHPKSIGKDVWMLLDSGLARHVMKTDEGEGATLSLTRHKVLQELFAHMEYGQGRSRVYHYRSAKGSPVDLVSENEEAAFKIIVQGRGASTGLGWHERPLAGAMKALGLNRGFLLSPISEIEIPKKNGIGLLPWSFWS